ncbi:MAG TPA: protein phosphatase 2C domain-containing protein [Propionibacteriaceae bacterium]|nr:protein phosphatase 2C domain-containing protein [Propionibacteriaceae bacterium]
MAERFAEVSVITHDGLLRDHNEDSVVVGPWTTCATVTTAPATFALPLVDPVVVAVSDGLGGHPAGEVASSVVVQTLARLAPQLTDADAVRQAVEACNRMVFAEAARHPAREGMGTTIAGVVLTPAEAYVFNVGDSRVYTYGPEGMLQISVDDSPPLPPGATHTAIITQILGGYGDPEPLDVHVSTHPIDQDTRYLVCTDGLSDVIDDAEIAAVLEEDRGVAAAFELWRAAITGGGPDNISVAIVEIVSAETPSDTAS